MVPSFIPGKEQKKYLSDLLVSIFGIDTSKPHPSPLLVLKLNQGIQV